MKDLGEAKKILGMEMTRDIEGGKVCLTQKQYMNSVSSFQSGSHMKLSASLSPRSNENENVCLEFHMLMLLEV